MAAAQPFSQPLGLWIEARLVGDALPEDPLDDEVHRPQVGQHMAGDGEFGLFLFRKPKAAQPSPRVATPLATQLGLLDEARARTRELVAPLSDADLERQHSPLMSPLAWDLGHCAHAHSEEVVKHLGEIVAILERIEEAGKCFFYTFH